MITDQEVRKLIDRIKPNGILQTQIIECLYALLNLIIQLKPKEQNKIDELINKVKEKQ